MSIMQSILFYVPSWVLGFIVVGGMTALSILGLVVVRHLVPHHKMKVHHDVAGPIFGTLGVIYAVLLTFVTVMVWGQFDKSRQGVTEEVSCLASLYRATGPFPDEFKDKVRLQIKSYADAVIHKEWPRLAMGAGDEEVDRILEGIWASYLKYVPKNVMEEAFFSTSIDKLDMLEKYRALRIVESRTGLPILMWIMLFMGGTITIIFMFFFGVENFKVQVIMATLLVLIVAIMLFAIMSMDHPFTGSMAITPEAFKQIGLMMII